jgi:hypothetical protein
VSVGAWLALAATVGDLGLVVAVWWYRREGVRALADRDAARQDAERIRADLAEVQRVSVELEARHAREMEAVEAAAAEQADRIRRIVASHPGAGLGSEYLLGVLRSPSPGSGPGAATPVLGVPATGKAPGSK